MALLNSGPHQRRGKSEGETVSAALLLAGLKNPMGLRAHRVFLR